MAEPLVCSFVAELTVSDSIYLVKNYRDHQCNPVSSASEAQALLFFATNAEKDEGVYTVKEANLKECGPGRYELTVTADVHDLDQLRSMAEDSAEASFGSAEFMDEYSPGEILSELILSSNLSDSPLNLGYEIVSIGDNEPLPPSRHQKSAPGMEP